MAESLKEANESFNKWIKSFAKENPNKNLNASLLYIAFLEGFKKGGEFHGKNE